MNNKVNTPSLLYVTLLTILIVVNGSSKVNGDSLLRTKSRKNDVSVKTISEVTTKDTNDLIRMTNDDVIVATEPYEINMQLNNYTSSISSERNLQGSRTVLPLRVTVSGIGSPSISRDEIYSRIFSDGNSVKHQMSRCSAGAIQFDPTNHGVMDVYINGNWGTSRVELINQATTTALSMMGNGYSNIRDAANHVMFIMPNLGDNYVGSAEVCNLGMSCTSQFGDSHGVSLSVVMHELGHNLGLKHAGANGNQYGDVTSNMGMSSGELGGPLACYNGANHWYLGWFMDGRLDLTNVPSSPITVNIPAFVDYAETVSASDQYVLVKAGNFYLQYNRAKDYNIGARALPDQLVVTWDGNPGPTGETSLVTGLSMSNPYYSDGSTVSIQVCNVVTNGNVDYMVVSIGQRNTNCQASTFSSATTSANSVQQQPSTSTTSSSSSSSTSSSASSSTNKGRWSTWNSWK